MMVLAKRCLVGMLLFGLVVRTCPGIALACCPAFAVGEMVRIADQRILVVWDPETKVEHFVREAGFQHPRRRFDPTVPPGFPVKENETDGDQADGPDGKGPGDSKGFGFLVPSPSRPEIAESDGSVFGNLSDAIRPRIETVDEWKVVPTALVLMPLLLQKGAPMTTSRSVDNAPLPMGAVNVLETKRVAGYDVAVLEASDAEALTRWLDENGYDSRPSLTQWAEPYVAKGWIVTAFKYAADADRVEAGAVRMSFKTDRPIFPYRVPADQIDEGGSRNLLRTYVVGPGRATGILGEGDNASPWLRGYLRYSKPASPAVCQQLIGAAIPQGAAEKLGDAWLTAFDDNTWPSGTEDLWFDFDKSAPQHQEVKRVVNQRTVPIPVDLIALLVGIGIVVGRRRGG
jgi:hypothetical protein